MSEVSFSYWQIYTDIVRQEAKTALEGKTPEEIAAALKELPADQLAKTLGESNLQGFGHAS